MSPIDELYVVTYMMLFDDGRWKFTIPLLATAAVLVAWLNH